MADSPKRPLEDNETSNTKKPKIKKEKSSLGLNDSNAASDMKREDSNLALPKVESNTSNTDVVALALPKGSDKKKNKANAKNGTGASGKGKNDAQQKPQSDPNKMQDVLISAGVDLKEEEALLSSSVTATKAQSASVVIPQHPPFLHPDQVSKFMSNVAKAQHFNDNFSKNPEILDMISSACENYMRDIITNTMVVSRHRRRGVKVNSGRRSQVAVALRSLAINQKKEEERRMKKRIALGLEKEDYENKMDSEETLHRASNVTATLRAGSKKQYGWLTSSVNKPASIGVRSQGKVATEIAARGDTGLKFREAREEPGIVMRDLLFALEHRRIGVHNVISKGYARIRD
ncbi:Transcription initiation factor TFIID subunit 4 [Nakaseomyces bracarensis]|uniref:Transcription initiation factor TFIID subunit 4 n=1 Tax=Nakaseomyces bracarensis TaxID=273131 RepID=A0ABR4NQB0_9SACH